MRVDEQFIREAILLAMQAREHGNHPFGALLVVDDRVTLTAENTVNSDNNPTSHAETNLVQRAIRERNQDQIAGATLYTSCEPCAMCAGMIYWAGIRKVVYALSSEDLAGLAGGSLNIACRVVFERAAEEVEVAGPFSIEEAIEVHKGYWVRDS